MFLNNAGIASNKGARIADYIDEEFKRVMDINVMGVWYCMRSELSYMVKSGGGVIINDKLYSGTNGIASEIGHLIVGENFYNCNCGNNGCLETYCSATAIIKYAQRLFVDSPCSKIIEMTDSKPENITAKLIFDAYKEKDLMAKIIVKRFVNYLSIGIINLMNVYDPEVFVIGGGVSKAYDLFIDELEKEVDERLTFKNAPRGKIVKAKLGNDAGAIGAAMLGLYM